MAPGVEKYAYVCMQEMIRLVLTPAHMGIFWILKLMATHQTNILTCGGTERHLFQGWEPGRHSSSSSQPLFLFWVMGVYGGLGQLECTSPIVEK